MSAPTDSEIYDKICSSGIMSDLEVDSVAVFDLIMELEDHYDISIPMEMVSDIKTVGELVLAVKGLTA